MPTRLSVCRPSPATVQFTVSNVPSRTTFSSKLAFYLEVFLRFAVFTSVLLVDLAKLRGLVFYGSGLVPWDSVWSSAIGGLASRIADSRGWLVVGLCSAVAFYLVFRKGYTEESLLVLRGLGVQTSTSSSTYFAPATTRFIPTTQIQDIVIHEAFRGFEVRFYLAIIVEGESEVVVVFPNLLPRRPILEEVWKGSRKCLYEPGP
ncbi:hypothetical protein VTO42DRAFT_1461 [Malbranchea cinnamomea]